KAFVDGGGTEGYRELIEECGWELAARAFPEETRQKLTASREEHLILSLDEALVAVPWELAIVGEEPLALKFATGRMVATSADAREGQAVPGWSGRILVVADAAGNLAEAAREGKAVAAILRKCFASQVELVVGPVKAGRLKEMLGEASLLHIAGHAGQGGEIACADGAISVDELVAATGSVPPALVFANSCYSTSGGGFVDTSRVTTDMASRFLLKGCRHFLGPLWSVADSDAMSFALRFYEKLVSGYTVGESVRKARKSLHDRPDSAVAYASYVLYGDPRERLPASLRLSEKKLRSAQAAAQTVAVPAEAGRSARHPVLRWTTVAAIAALVWAGLVALVFLRHGDGGKAKVSPAGEEKVMAAAGSQAGASAVKRKGPIRLCVLPFKNLTGDSKYDFIQEGMTEAVVTDFGSNPKIRLIERGQIDLDIKEIEFSNSKYVDPATRARLGRIVGAEVVVLGAVQKAQGVLRAQARFVDVETGEILLALKVDRPEGKVFELQDALSERLRTEAVRLVEMLRR
ncbi:MAG: CHAT domain-containing protein, partial [Deltaproteobacteria bacterium]